MNGLIRLRTKRTNDYIPLMKVMVSTASEEPDIHTECIRMIFKVMEIAEKLDGYVQEIEDYPELELGENYVVGITLQFQKNLKMLEFVKSLKENLK
ncbi:MAG: hypothetical protein V8S04_07055 [Clostridia bacterium]|jgi:hypothetical protein